MIFKYKQLKHFIVKTAWPNILARRILFLVISIIIILFLLIALMTGIYENDTLFGGYFLGLFTEMGAIVGGLVFILPYKVFGINFLHIYFTTLNCILFLGFGFTIISFWEWPGAIGMAILLINLALAIMGFKLAFFTWSPPIKPFQKELFDKVAPPKDL